MKQILKSFPGVGLPWKIASGIKNKLYDQDVLPMYRAPVPVLSIGNLTMGGTGKTPIMLDLVSWFENQYQVGVVNRSYGGSLNKPLCLDLKNALYDKKELKTADVVGDEALLLQQKFKKASVFTGPSKSESAEFASQTPGLNFLVVDDGFQHRRLVRDCDVVILDATETMQNYECFPLGRGREEFSSIVRADAIFITKINLAPVIQVQKLIQRVEKACQEAKISPVPPIYQFDFVNDHIDQVICHGEPGSLQRQTVSFSDLLEERWMAVSAIGNPESFERSLKSLNLRLSGHLRFPDHHAYHEDEIKEILEKSKGKKIILTEKDLVKWSDMKVTGPWEVYVLCQRVSCLTDKEACYRFLYEKMTDKFGTRV